MKKNIIFDFTSTACFLIWLVQCMVAFFELNKIRAKRKEIFQVTGKRVIYVKQRIRIPLHIC